MPKEGPKCIPLGFSFVTAASFDVNLTNFMDRGKISIIQGAYIDNSTNPNAVTITVATTQQNITVKAYSQMYVPVFGVQPFNCVVSSTINASGVTYIDFYNVPIAPCNWDSTTLNNQGTISTSDVILDATVLSTPYGSGVNVSDKTVFTPLATSQIGGACVTAVALAVPNGGTPTRALIQCETQNCRWRDDGIDPTAALGNLLVANNVLEYNGDLTKFKIIQTTATATFNASFYR